jgi:ferric-dicitrate binding protein FerR (iron transport regulator)
MREREEEPAGVGDGELGADEREALAAWHPPAPPDGFADRVLAAREAAPTAPEPEPVPVAAGLAGLAAPMRDPGRRRRAAPWLIVAAAAVGAVAVGQLRSPANGTALGDPTGRVTPAERHTVRLGGRGVAVVEAGADLAWVIEDGAARVTQRAGDVFYRVERGGLFEVDTPRGTVRVTGTCFRVELTDMKTPWQGVAGAAIGAALVVTVYEGSVLFAGRGGEERPVSAGQVLTAGDGGSLVADRRAGGEPPTAGQGGPGEAAIAAPGADVTRDDLLRRDAVQRAEIASLRTRVRELGPSGGIRVRRGQAGEPDESGRPWFDPSSEDLVRFAQECRLRVDMPPLLRPETYSWGPRMGEEAGLSGEELAAVNAALAALQRDYIAQLRALYIEITGDAAHADDLSGQAMASEIGDKSPEGEEARVGQRIAQERAGLVPPPATGAAMSPVERYVRRRAGLSAETERVIGGVVGAERAKAIHEQRGDWGMRQESVGCWDGE